MSNCTCNLCSVLHDNGLPPRAWVYKTGGGQPVIVLDGEHITRVHLPDGFEDHLIRANGESVVVGRVAY